MLHGRGRTIVSMRESSFVERRQPRWNRLEELIHAVERRGLPRLDGEEVTELAHLYRSATTDLAVARGRGYRADIIQSLNRSVARAHAVVYAENAPTGWERVREFIVKTLPQELRRSSKIIGLCAGLFVVASVVAYLAVARHPHLIYSLVPESAIPGPIKKSLHDSNFAVHGVYAPAMSAMVITNNIRVAIMEFAGGMTAGLLTVYFLVFNGWLLGALAALFAAAGFGYDFYATVAPHGAVELPSIVIAAAAGVIIGKSFVLPGKLKRIDALKLAARRAAVLLIGVATLLVWAGIFEGFVSPRRIGPEARLAIGAANAALLLAYCIFAGRKRPIVDSST